MSSQALTSVKIRSISETDPYIPEIVITTNCMRCDRKLTAPKSVAAGIGPVCDRNVAYEQRRQKESPGYIYTSRTFAYLERKDRVANSVSSEPLAIPTNVFVRSTSYRKMSFAGNGASSSVTYCSCCERHGVTSQVKAEISSEIGQILSVCDDCEQAKCDLTSDHCLFEQFNRPSPVSKFFS